MTPVCTLAALLVLLHSRAARAGPPLPSQLQALVDAAVAAGAPFFSIPPTDAGSYFFGAANFTVVGASDFDLDGAGVTLWFAPGFGVYCANCARVRLRNFTIDYQPLAFAQGTLVSLNPSNASFVADFDAPEPSGLAEYPLPDSSLYPWFVNGTITTGGNKAMFWGTGRNPTQLPNQTGVCLWSATWRADAARPRRYGVSLNNAPFTSANCFKDGTYFGSAVAGVTRVTVSPRDGFALQLVNSSACVVEDVVAYGAGSMAFAEFSGAGGHAWRRLLLTRRPATARLLSANADGFQSSSARVGPLLEDSELAFIADDFVNVHSRIAVVLAAEPPDALVIVDSGGAGIPCVGASRPGDALHFFAPYTAPVAALGAAAVAAVAPVDDAATWAAARALPAAMNAPRVCASAPAAPCVRDFSATAVPWRVTFPRGALPAGLPKFALVQAAAVQSAGALLRNNRFHDGFDKCASMNGSNGTLAGNFFRGVNAQPCVDVGGYFFWLEGALGLANVSIVNNTFVGLGESAAEVVAVHDAANVTVSGNVFAQLAPGRAAPSARLGSVRAMPRRSAHARARAFSAAAVKTAAAPLAAAVQLWNTSLAEQWWTGVALLPGLQNFVASFGNWYAPPYSFFVSQGSLSAPTPPALTSSAVPGSVLAAGGLTPLAPFSAMSFTDEAAFFGLYGATADAFPAWSESAPGVSGNWWEVGAPMATSANGSVLAYARTALARYDPLAAKAVEVAVLDVAAFPPRVLLADAFPNGTGLQALHLSDDGATLVVVAAQDPAGRINSSQVRVYDVGAAAVRADFVTGYALASCMAADGRTLVLATCDSENAIEVWALGGAAGASQLVNSSYPPLPGTFTYVAVCAVTPARGLWVAAPLWWGGAINQTAVAFYALPDAAAPGYLAPASLWLSPPIADALQDDIAAGAYTSGFFAVTSWGGAALNASAPGAASPPTLRLFADAAPAAPILELATPSAGDAAVSGSLEAFDMAANGSSLVILAEGLNGHANDGSSGGVLYLWEVMLS